MCSASMDIRCVVCESGSLVRGRSIVGDPPFAKGAKGGAPAAFDGAPTRVFTPASVAEAGAGVDSGFERMHGLVDLVEALNCEEEMVHLVDLDRRA